MLEKDLWAKIRDNPLNLNMFFQRIESSTADGIPDLYWISPLKLSKNFSGPNGISPKVDGISLNEVCMSGWCELKYLQETRSGRYNLSLGKYTLIQREWNSQHTRAGGITLLCVGVGPKIFWLMGKKAVTILKFTESEIEGWAIDEGVEFPIKNLSKLTLNQFREHTRRRQSQF